MVNDNDLTIENSLFIFLDHQPYNAAPVHSIQPDELLNNVTALAKVAKLLNVPVLISTMNAQGLALNNPLIVQLRELFADLEPIDRHNTNAWSDPEFVKAIEKSRRTKLVISGLLTEVTVAQTVVSATKAGYDVYVVSNACGGLTHEAHQDAKALMAQEGAKSISWYAVMAALCPDSTAPEAHRLYDLVVRHAGGSSFALQYAMANMNQLPATSVAFEAHKPSPIQ